MPRDSTHPGHQSAAREVLVVGAGPVGLTAAIELRRRGLTVRIIDAKSGPATTSRALGTHARTLEVYGHMGVLDEVLARSQPLACFTVYTAGRRTTSFGYDFGGLHPLVPHSAFIGQAETEGVLRDRLLSLGTAVEWGVRLGSFQDLGDAVSARLILDGREESIRAAWLIGTDGGHSTVRKQLGLPFDGAADETWIVADGFLETDLPCESIHMVRHRDGNLLLFPFPEPGKWRVLETNPPPEGRPIDESQLAAA